MYRIQTWLRNRNYVWKYKLQICLPVIAVLIGIDWLSKLAVIKTMQYGDSSSFIPHFLQLHYALNLGSAYGSNKESPVLAIILASIFTFFVIVLFIFGNNRRWLFGLAVLIGGSLANLFGRTWSPAFQDSSGVIHRGAVIDFLQFDFRFLGSDTYIFNLADVFVIAGIVLIGFAFLFELIKWFRNRPIKKKSESTIEPTPEREQREASQNDY